MFNNRIIPVLQLRNESLVKTVRFDKFKYIGDPCNTVRIFNELEVDELALIDIDASCYNRKPNFQLLEEIASECFMPLSYGGGIKNVNDASTVFKIGFEKVILNSILFENISVAKEISKIYGNQAVVGSIDFKRTMFNRFNVFTYSGKKKINIEIIDWAMKLEDIGIGEIILTSIDLEGTWKGYEYDLISEIADRVSIPVIANGGCGSEQDIIKVIRKSKASAAATSSFVLYQKKDYGVLLNVPKIDILGYKS